jgi:hypothetical protein
VGARDNDKIEYKEDFADGPDASEAEAVWYDENRVLTSGASETLDLTAMLRALFADVLTITFYAIKTILIVNKSTSAGTLTVGGAAADEWYACFGSAGDQVKVLPDGTLLLQTRATGWTVDDTHKDLKLAASGGDVTFDIAIVGTLYAPGSGGSSSGA